MAWNLNPIRWDDEVLEILRKEFYGRFTEDEYYQTMELDLKFSSQDIRSGNSAKATDMFVVRDAQTVIGVLVLKYFAWDIISPQLYFEAVEKTGKLVGLSLKPLKTLIPEVIDNTQLVGELAYFWVDPSMRGKGMGSFLFKQAIQQFRLILSAHDIAMTLSLGSQVGSGVGRKLKQAMLEFEQKVNGMDQETGRINVRGEIMSAEVVHANFGLTLTDIQSSDRSKATEILALKHAMKFRGYSSNLSLLYASKLLQTT
jgi:predicted N-acetyltransferase YhbS